MDYNQLEALIKNTGIAKHPWKRKSVCANGSGTHEVPERFKDTAKLFSYFDEQKQKQQEHNSKKRLSKMTTEGKVEPVAKQHSRSAGIAVVATAIFFVRQGNSGQAWHGDHWRSAKARWKKPKALMMISKGFSWLKSRQKKSMSWNEAEDKVKEKRIYKTDLK